jgi:cytochrome c oxidase subunit 2
MAGPLDGPDGNWWDNPVNRRETLWLGIAGAWSLGIFGWMSGFTRFGDQNPTGETYEVDPDEFQNRLGEYRDEAARRTVGDEDNVILPPDESVYVMGRRFSWSGLPVALEVGTEYDMHLSAADVQHGFSVRPEESLSQQINLQMLPGTEWVVPMTFEDPGTYHVICNEFCGVGHRRMHGKFFVLEEGEL